MAVKKIIKKNKKKPGAKTDLTPQLISEIKNLVLDGESYADIMKKLKIPEGTWYSWMTRNTQSFNDNLDKWNRKYLLKKSMENMKEIMELDKLQPAIGPFGPIIDKKTKKPYMKLSLSVIKEKREASKFVLETLNKKHFSKRTEVTGRNGGPVKHKAVEVEDDEFSNIINGYGKNRQRKKDSSS